MKSQKIVAYGEPLELVEEVVPKPVGTEVLVKVAYCGVCHSDLHIHDGYFILGDERKLDVTSRRNLPFTLGHEIQGSVSALGPEANGIKIGEEFVVYPWIGCGRCEQCERGFENLCPRNKCLGTVINGGFSDFLLAPHPRYLLDASGIPPSLAGTYMCSGLTAYSALKKVGDLPEGGRILILGLGGVGSMGLQIARNLYGDSVLCADLDFKKRELGLAAGALAAYDPGTSEVAKDVVKDSGGGVHAVVDFVGSMESSSFGMKCLQNGGRLILVGLFGGGLKLDLPLLTLQGHSIIGSITGSLAEAKELLALGKKGQISPIPIEERSLHEANSVLDDLREGNIVGRAVLVP